jgi:hypothetical protein
MDPRTAIVAIQLQLGDIAEILEDLQDTQKPADNERASLKTIQQDLVQQLATLEGQVLVIKLLKAEFGQRAAYKKLLEEERQAVKDHQFALSLEEMSTNDTNHTSHTDHKAHFNAADTVDDDPQWEMAKDLYKSAFKGLHEMQRLHGDCGCQEYAPTAVPAYVLPRLSCRPLHQYYLRHDVVPAALL